MKHPPAIEQFWHEACAATLELSRETAFQVFKFADNEALSNHVLVETLAGRNRATASLRWDYGDDPPKVGDVAIITDWAGAPRAVVVTRRVDIVPYAQVDADFARAEGYVTDPLSEWREVHWAYFSRCCSKLGRTPSLDMPVVCERFELVYHRPPEREGDRS